MWKWIRGASTIGAPWTLFHIVTYSRSDSSNKEAVPIFAIESTSLQNNKGPWLLPIFVLIDLAYLQTLFKLLSNRFQQIIRWHWKSLLTLGVLCRLSEKHSPLLHIASSCELQIIYRYKRAQTFRFGFCDIRNDQGRGKRFYLGFKCTKYNLGKSETKIVACNMQAVSAGTDQTFNRKTWGCKKFIVQRALSTDFSAPNV